VSEDRQNWLDSLSRLAQNAPSSSNDAMRVKVKSLKLPDFDENGDIDCYLLQFERIAQILKWEKSEWAIRLACQLKGKAAEVFTQLPFENTQNYDILKAAVLARYTLHAETCRVQFRTEEKKTDETFCQFIYRLRLLLRRWLSLDGKSEGNYADLEDLIIREQLFSTFDSELELFVRYNAPKDVETAARLADQFDCGKSAVESRNCGNRDHEQPANSEISRIGNCHAPREVVSQFVRVSSEKAPAADAHLACEIGPHPVTIDGISTYAIRDTGSTDVIVDAERVPVDAPVVGHAQLSTITGQMLTAPLVAIDVESPFFQGKVHAAAVSGVPSPLLIGNRVVFADGRECSVPVVVKDEFTPVQPSVPIQREQKMHVETERVTVPGTNVTHDQVRKFQQVDKSLRKHTLTAKTLRSDCQHGSYFMHGGLLYRKFSPRKHVNIDQLVIPSGLRPEILRFAHDQTSVNGMGIRKTANRLLQSFYWPGMKSDIRRYRQTRS
jgi:hypothetical protein